MMEMLTIVVYDITEDKIRNKIADRCKDYGLERFQFSAFIGWLNQNKREELFLNLCSLLEKSEGSIWLFPICQKDQNQIKIWRTIKNEQGKIEILTQSPILTE